MNFLKRCNGYSVEASGLINRHSTVYIDLVNTIDQARELFKHLHASGEIPGEYHYGSRFNNTDSVIFRIESALETVEELDQLGLMNWALDALRDCASADHWYTFEKDWGNGY